MTQTPPESPQTWGVSVEQVSALAPHIPIDRDPETPPPGVPTPPANNPYNAATVRRINRSQVEGWIEEIAGHVSLRLWALSKFVPTSPRRIMVENALGNVVANGAAHYLVAAAFPIKAGPNENTSYAEVLRLRYQEALDGYVEMLEEWLSAGGNDLVATPIAARRGGIYSSFPGTIFEDGFGF